MSTKTEIPALPPLDLNRRLSVNQALQYLNISRGTFYKMVAQNRIKTITEGKRRLVPVSEIARLCAAPAYTGCTGDSV